MIWLMASGWSCYGFIIFGTDLVSVVDEKENEVK